VRYTAAPRGVIEVHEWALAEGVVVTAQQLSQRQGFKRVTRIVVRVGELQRISPEFFRQALDAVMPEDDPAFRSVEFQLELERAGFSCRRCDRVFALEDVAGELDRDAREAIHFIPELAHGFLRCPGCDSPDFEVTRGRGIWIDRVEGET